jgi:ABC-type transporter Mla maintaining outer membrane lipid asymmetry ATPase subunit MlaF
MIRETGKLNDCPQRDSLIQLLATQMRKSYIAWNRSEINNEQIAQDIWDISDGKILLNPELVQFVEQPVVRESFHAPQGRQMKNRKKFKKYQS